MTGWRFNGTTSRFPMCRCPKAVGGCENCGLLPRVRELGWLSVRCSGRLLATAKLCGRAWRRCRTVRLQEGNIAFLGGFLRGSTTIPRDISTVVGYRQGRGRSIAIGSKMDGSDRSGVVRDSTRWADGMRFSVNGEIDGAVRVAEVFAVVAPLWLLVNGGWRCATWGLGGCGGNLGHRRPFRGGGGRVETRNDAVRLAPQQRTRSRRLEA